MASPTNAVRFNATTSGAVDFVVASAPSGYVTPEAAGVIDGKTYKYYAQSADGTQWQAGFAPYSISSHTLQQSLGTISGTSNADQMPVNFITIPIIDVYGSPSSGLEQVIPAGSVMLFWQAAAPVGWTKLTTQNDKALRVVSGTGGVSGGTNAFSAVMAQSVVGSSTLSSAQLATHNHLFGAGTYSLAALTSINTGGQAFTSGTSFSVPAYINSTDSLSGGSSHNHTLTMSIQYIDLILASKN